MDAAAAADTARRPGRTKAPQQFKVCAAPGVGRAPGARRLSKSGNDNDFYYPSHLKKCKAGLLSPAPTIPWRLFPYRARPASQRPPNWLITMPASTASVPIHCMKVGRSPSSSMAETRPTTGTIRDSGATVPAA